MKGRRDHRDDRRLHRHPERLCNSKTPAPPVATTTTCAPTNKAAERRRWQSCAASAKLLHIIAERGGRLLYGLPVKPRLMRRPHP